MSMGYRGKTTNLDYERSVVQAMSEVETKYSDMPGEIVEFDSNTQTATIKPLFMPTIDGTSITLPNLLEVPVRFDRAGSGALTYAVKAGDYVVLRPYMRATDNYHTGGDYQTNEARYCDLSDMEAYVMGGERITNPIQNFDTTHTHLRFNESGTYGVKGNAEGAVEIESNGIDIKFNESGTYGIKGSNDGRLQINGNQGNIYELLVELSEEVADEHDQNTTLQTIATKLRAMVL